jgi:hypothetical protein
VSQDEGEQAKKELTHETLSVFDILGLDAEDLDWRHLAVCKGQDISLFHERYENNVRVARNTDAMCLSCPVRKECLQTGVENGEWGVWGGVFLVSGRMDEQKNAHKTQDIWEQIREGIE